LLVVALNGNYKKNHRHLTSLVKYLVDQEIKVSFLFHDPKVEIDKKGKDTANHQKAGAIITVAASTNSQVILGSITAPPNLFNEISLMGKTDIIFVSGYECDNTIYKLCLNEDGKVDLLKPKNMLNTSMKTNEKLISLINQAIAGVDL
jgi:molybdopterin-guanine dinucleotide biosynthesis protein MobB|tara:strand:- start:46 stop:489 length:444 start_codon:yes stop_codon:yes gene_type:complete